MTLIAYEARDRRVFVRVPGERGRYVLTSRCVVEVPCRQCGAQTGEPCLGRNGYMVDPHYTRRQAYRHKRAGWEVPGPPPDQLEGDDNVR